MADVLVHVLGQVLEFPAHFDEELAGVVQVEPDALTAELLFAGLEDRVERLQRARVWAFDDPVFLALLKLGVTVNKDLTDVEPVLFGVWVLRRLFWRRNSLLFSSLLFCSVPFPTCLHMRFRACTNFSKGYRYFVLQSLAMYWSCRITRAA